MLEIGRRVPAGCCVLGGQRDLTLARWAVAVSLGCCAERNQAAKPQVSLLPDPLRCWCGTADPEAEEHVYIKCMFGLQTDCSQSLLVIKFDRSGNGEVQNKLCTKQHEWILRFLGEGLRDKHCCELCD
ncbi:uncharacterized protein LOC110475109 isoform X1 [Lonchura striata]